MINHFVNFSASKCYQLSDGYGVLSDGFDGYLVSTLSSCIL